MTDIQVLPYVQPDKQLTAQHRPRSLEEHFLAFLCENNKNGFDKNKVLPQNSVERILFEFQRIQVVPLDTFKKKAWRVKKMTKNAIQHSNCLHLLARALGYLTYEEALRLNKDNVIRNITVTQ